jgi:hypothetical protein
MTTKNEALTVREACRRRMPLDGADAQALEGALAMTERDRDEAWRLLEAICGEFERTIRHAEWVAAGSKGMSVPFHGDFASVAHLPSVIGRMRWWSRDAPRPAHLGGKAVTNDELDAIRARAEHPTTAYLLSFAPDDILKLLAEVERLTAEVEMLRGVGCMEDGDGPCGACRKCAFARGAVARGMK